MSGRLPGAARKRSGSESPATAREVDLHLPSGKGSPESLERQLARLRGELNSAIRAGEKEIVFIHGVGTGRLREALLAIIKAEYPGCTCYDASFNTYGYKGATRVKTGK
jgi:dsDNA-specific endonuclease/ATPase MutS2